MLLDKYNSNLSFGITSKNILLEVSLHFHINHLKAPLIMPHTMLVYQSLLLSFEGNITKSANGFSFNIRLHHVPSVFHNDTSAYTPRNILKANFAITSIFVLKSLQSSIFAIDVHRIHLSYDNQNWNQLYRAEQCHWLLWVVLKRKRHMWVQAILVST